MDTARHASETSPARPATPFGTDGAFSATVSAISDAFGDPTRRRIFLMVRDRAEGMTASEVANAVEIHPNVARHHLDKLAAGGYVEVAPHRTRPSGAGRPSKRYRACADAHEEIPTQVDSLLLTLLARSLSLLPADQVEAMATDIGREHGRAIAMSMTGDEPLTTQRSLKAAVQSVVDALNAHGFAARVDHDDNETQIVNTNCPFGAIVARHPVICSLERGLVQGMLSSLHGGVGVVAHSSRARGDARCATIL